MAQGGYVERLLVLVIVAGLWLPPSRAAGQVASNNPAPPLPRRRLSLTIFPWQIAMPLARMGPVYPFELTGEVCLTDKVGVALIFGGGRNTKTDTADQLQFDALAIDAGIQARYYPLGDFSGGLSLAWELYWWDIVRISTLLPDGATLGAENRGVTSGGLVGYKHIWPVGFTIDGQVGYGFIVYTKGYVFDEPSRTVLLNLKAGWSF